MGLKLAHPYPPLQLGRREQYLFEKVAGKVVVDLGFVDVGHERLEKGGLFHLEIKKRARAVFGVDIDDSYRHLFPPESEDYRLYFGNVEDAETFRPIAELGVEIDLVIAGEIMEHLNNPGLFLDAVRTVMSDRTVLVVSVPNGLRAINHGYNQKGMEWVHPDHNYWYSPTTIQTLLNKNGFHVDFLRGYTFGNETAEMLGPSGLGCPGLICEARLARAGEALRRWPNTSVATTAAGAVLDVNRGEVASGVAAGTVDIGTRPKTPAAARAIFAGPRRDDRPRLLVITDQRGWAYENIIEALKAVVSDRFEIETIPFTELNDLGGAGLRQAAMRADAVYCFSAVMPDAVYDILSVRPMAAGIHNDYQLEHYADRLTAERLSRFAVVGCANETLAGRTREAGLHDRVMVTASGIDPSRFSPPEGGRSGPVIRAGWAGQVQHSAGKCKRFYELALPAAVRAGVPLLPAIREKNPIPHDLMCEYYRLVDVHLCVSRGEGASGPLLEAASSGCCPISTRVGVAEQQIEHGVNGLLVDETIESVTGALYFCRTHPNETREMGMAARRNVLEHWTWRKRAEEYAALFDVLVAGRAQTFARTG